MLRYDKKCSDYFIMAWGREDVQCKMPLYFERCKILSENIGGIAGKIFLRFVCDALCILFLVIVVKGSITKPA